jgi:Carboxypeptidase regulatory-like domain
MLHSVIFRGTESRHRFQGRRLRFRAPWRPGWHSLCLLIYCLAGPAHAQQSNLVDTLLPNAPTAGRFAGQEIPGPNPVSASGSIRGMVVDPNGNFIFAALIQLTREGQSEKQEVTSDKEGHFVFTGVAAGPFKLTVIAEGFAIQEVPGTLNAGETLELPEISLHIAAATTEVRVSVTNYELAEEQVKIEETQRVFGVIPNFYVSYQQDTLPLSPRQKFELAWKSSVDPVSFAVTGLVAGVEQAQGDYSGYGQGAQGYAKRYGASYGDAFVGVMVGGAILPTLLKQDPRYFYKGTGSIRSRTLYALANAVVCKGDNGRWQPDYSGILGGLAAGGISNLYYPAGNRNGAWLTFENTFISIGGSAITNLFQEFLVRKLTPHTRGPQTINP